MRRFLMIAAAAAIALVGLSANQCGGSGDQAETKPAEEAPAAAPESTEPMTDDTSTDGSGTE